MQIFLVGGAVRDQLLGLPVRERDYVVVGATPSEMLAQGFKQVGRDFPVFLHPVTHEEYALARSERKVGPGYVGFHCFTSPEITLEQDLLRRDLTINAMAMDAQGKIVDPYGGQQDLHAKILRHVSPAFVEDPVRVLRIARFAARFGDFRVDETTLQLLCQMTRSGELDVLVAERVLQEFFKAMSSAAPDRFFKLLKTIAALKILFPELDAHYSAVIALTASTAFRAFGADKLVKFCSLASLLSDNNDGRQADNDNTKQQINGLYNLKRLTQRYPFPKNYYAAGKIALFLHQRLQYPVHGAAELLQLIERLDGFRRTQLLQAACTSLTARLVTCSAYQARVAALRSVLARTLSIKLTPAEIQQTEDKTQLGAKLHDKRLRWISNDLPYSATMN